MAQTWKTYAAVSVVALGALGVFIWRKKKRTYVRVGKIAKIYFFPIKSMKGYEVSQGKCTKAGLEVNGLLDRAFMLISEDGMLLSQRQAPRLALLPAPQISGKYLLLTQPSGPSVKVEIKDSPASEDKVLECRVHTDSVTVVDCGDEVASWFQVYLEKPGVRLVRYFPSLPARKYLRKDPFYSKLKKEHPIGLQDLAAIHLLSQASIDDLNSRIED
ncbi:mitochondrial amidoxime reducing component 2-like, partial [Stegodyphus dumicola]|uniref:mitochondrial amidoxime reducing component 2-like n=1 Tax=Stegodyphus dumicola TaxID=202533 RepID=UPI0015AC2551